MDTQTYTTPREARRWIAEALEAQDAETGSLQRIETFEDAEIMTSNEGLVVTFADGSEYQLTLVRSA